ncbi:hypothetical protein [Gilvimarinus chinensis]|uniref:hypothetical protein n=1 Tax=Gilvimarinus chinensis TaxID=396005 RepID=UPI00037637EB|nr:hypothetical protein [Gilvimarinus chinensis]
MYDDPRKVRYIRKATYLSEIELEEIEQASSIAGQQPAAFMREAAKVVSRFILGQSGVKPKADLLQSVQSRLRSQARPGAANDENILFSLAS